MALDDPTPEFIRALPIDVASSREPRILSGMQQLLEALFRDCDVSVPNTFAFGEVAAHWNSFLTDLQRHPEGSSQEPRATIPAEEVMEAVDSFHVPMIPEFVMPKFRAAMKGFLLAEIARQRTLQEIRSKELERSVEAGGQRIREIINKAWEVFGIENRRVDEK